MATNNLPPIKYTDKTSESILEEMVSAIPSLTDRWTDHNASDVGQTLLELFAWASENLLFYLDHQANEAFLATARERKNVSALCHLIAYRLSGPAGSTTTLVFTTPTSAVAPISIPRFTLCSTSGSPSLNFATIETTAIPTGQTAVAVGARQGTPATIQAATTGAASQVFVIPEANADSLSFEVIIDGVVWSQVTTFADAQSSDRVYVVNIAADGAVTVVLGDGFFGYLPSPSSLQNVTINYLVTDGASGNAGVGAVDTIVSDLGAVSISVTNPEAATGGTDTETIEHAKATAPAELSALYRSMTKQDFIALAQGYPGVGKALAWGEAEVNPPNYNLFNWAMVVVAPTGVLRADLVADPINNGQPSSELKKELRDYLYSKSAITTKIDIVNPVYKGIDLTLTVYVATGILPSVTEAAVEAAILNFFDFQNVNFGAELRLSQIFKMVMEVPGVDYTLISLFKSSAETDSVNDSIVLGFTEIPYLKTLTLTALKTVSAPPVPTLYPTAPVPNPLGD